MIEENATPPTDEEIANLLKLLEDGEINIETAVTNVAQTAPTFVIHTPPDDEQLYKWDETTTSWVLFSDYPEG
jgi:hypothetical protein